MQLVLDTKGLKLTTKGKSFHIVGEKSSRTISPERLDSIAITASILLSSEAVKLSIQNQVPILFFDYIGKAKARLWSPYFQSISTLRRQQVKFSEDSESAAWMVDLFWLKGQQQVDNLKYMLPRSPGNAKSLNQAIKSITQQSRAFETFRNQLPQHCGKSMMGVEGAIAQTYWQTLGNTLPAAYRFSKRSRRPAEDNFNAALNYLYGMLYAVVEGGLFAAGLDPHLGILHADQHAKPTLAFDMIEPFRPWIDKLLLEQCFTKKLNKAFFSKNQYGLFLNKNGKAFIIPLFNKFLRTEISFLKRQSTFKNHIYFLCSRLAQRIRSTIET